MNPLTPVSRAAHAPATRAVTDQQPITMTPNPLEHPGALAHLRRVALRGFVQRGRWQGDESGELGPTGERVGTW